MHQRIEKRQGLKSKHISVLLLSVFFICLSFNPNINGTNSKLSNTNLKIKRSADLNVLLITLDTTRADRLGCYGYERAGTPNLDSIAAGGVKFANTYTSVPLTLPSHCSIFTGTYPIYHRVRNNGLYYLGNENVTLAEILEKKGFRTSAFVSSFTVDSRFGLDQGFEVYDDTFHHQEILKSFRSERPAEEVFGSYSNWLDEHSDDKFFTWVHFYDPHLPYNPPSPFKEEYLGRPYDGEIAYMDHYLGETVAKLKEKKILEKTLIVVVGDHGEALGERREIEHGLFIYDNTLKVPFLLYCPKHLPAGVVIDARVNLIDVMPTVLDMLKISAGGDVQGRSCLDEIREKKGGGSFSYIETYFPLENFGWSPLTGLIEGDWKFIKAPKPELYNLRSDPGESQNVFQKEAKVSRRMVKLLEQFQEDFSSDKTGQRKRLTVEEERRLRSLGYFGAEAADGSSRGPLPDPKDKIEDYVLYFQGNLHETRGEFQKASEMYKEVLRRNSGVANNYVHLGFLYAKMGRLDNAIEVLEQGRERLPESYVILSKLIAFYSSDGRYDKALSTSQIMLDIDSRHFDALFLSGSVHAKLGNWAKAIGFYQKAMAIEPENKTLRQRYAYTLAALGRNEEALEKYAMLKIEYPKDAGILKEMSEVYKSKGNLDLAMDSLKAALDLEPTPEMFYDYAFLLEDAGKLEEAIEWLQKYIDAAPDKNLPQWKKAQATIGQWKKSLKKE
ncbi:sulfatase-like hydrolase/transferase [Acidobacteriota bacterium]